MRNKKKIGALLLAGTMMFSMGTSAFAADVPTVGKGEQASIKKDFVMAEGIGTPDYTFKFNVEKVTKDAPEATINDITFDSQENGKTEEGIKTVSKDSNISFGKFPHAGEYVYTVTETDESVEGVDYSTDTYTLRVYVKNGDNGPEIRNMTAEKGTSNGTDTNKVSEMKFTNTYRKNAPLEITKVTTGELADKTKDFDFTITITPSKTEKNPTSYKGKIGNEEVTVIAKQETTFQLHDGETLKFDSLPAGTRYVVAEKGASDGYTPSVTVIENGITTVTDKKASTDADGISSADTQATNLVGENENKVSFTNTYKDVPLTGIFMNNLPFVIVIGIAVLALGALAILKKQRSARR